MGQLIDRIRPYLLKIANEKMDPGLRRKIGASDIVQETMMTAHRYVTKFTGDSEAEWKAWLRTIVVNDIHNVRRKFRGTEKRQLDREVGIHGDSQSSSPGIDIPRAGPTPRSEAAMNEESLRLREAMERLPDEYRQVLQLRNWERLPFEEIGDQIGRSSEAARKLWSRAVARLQEELGDHGE